MSIRSVCPLFLSIGLIGCPKPEPRPAETVAPRETASEKCAELPKPKNEPVTTERSFVLRGEVDDSTDWTITPIFRASAGEIVVNHAAYLTNDVHRVFVATNHVDRCVRIYRLDLENDRWTRRLIAAKPKARAWARSLRLDRGVLYFGDQRYDPEKGTAPTAADAPPPELDRSIAPNGRRRITTTMGQMTLVDGDKKRTLIDDDSATTWTFGEVSWLNEHIFYFDNVDVAACIWEYDIRTDTLRKIVAAHDASGPYAFQLREEERKVVYRRPSGVFIASRSLPFPAPWTRARDDAAMKRAVSPYPKKWTMLTEADDAFVVARHCGIEVPTVELQTSGNDVALSVNIGMNDWTAKVSGTSTRVDELVVTYEPKPTKHRPLRFRHDPAMHVWWLEGEALGDGPKPYVAARDATRFKTTTEPCDDGPP